MFNQSPENNIIAVNHWWGSSTGPYHPSNPSGEGNRVSDGVVFNPWAHHSCVNNSPPNIPSNPNPPDGADNQPINIILSWTGGDPDGDDVTYDVYFGTEADPPLVSSRQPNANYDPGILNYETPYYWKIVAWDQLDASTQGPVWSFNTGLTPPSEFSKISPPDGVTTIPINPTLTWETSLRVDHYEFCYDDILNSSCDGSWTNVFTNTSVELSGLSYLTSYEWQIRAINAGGTTEANEDDWWEFTTVIEQPGDFSKLTPPDGAIDIPINPTLTWETSLRTDRYEYCYDDILNSSCDGTWTNVYTNTSVELSGLDYLTMYEWQIRAINAGGPTEADENDWWDFTTAIEQPSDFSKLSPDDGAVDVPINPTLTWETSLRVDHYEYCYDDILNSSCDSGTWTNIYSNTTVELTGLSDLTLYEWQIRAINDGGPTEANENDWWNFTTVIEKPGDFSKLAPPDGAIDIYTNLTLTWESSIRSDHYEYCYDTNDNDSCEGSWIIADETSVDIEKLNNGTTYYWQIRAINEGGSTEANDGEWWSFTIINNYHIFLPIMIK